MAIGVTHKKVASRRSTLQWVCLNRLKRKKLTASFWSTGLAKITLAVSKNAAKQAQHLSTFRISLRSANKAKDEQWHWSKNSTLNIYNLILSKKDTHLASLKEEIRLFLCDVMRPTFLYLHYPLLERSSRNLLKIPKSCTHDKKNPRKYFLRFLSWRTGYGWFGSGGGGARSDREMWKCVCFLLSTLDQ